MNGMIRVGVKRVDVNEIGVLVRLRTFVWWGIVGVWWGIVGLKSFCSRIEM